MKTLKTFEKRCLASWQQAVRTIVGLIILLLVAACQTNVKFDVHEHDDKFIIMTPNYTMSIQKVGFRHEFLKPNGDIIVSAHSVSGIVIGENDQLESGVVTTSLLEREKEQLTFAIVTEQGVRAKLLLLPEAHAVKIQVVPEEEGWYSILARTGGIHPTYGLADHAAFGDGSGGRSRTELTGFDMDPLRRNRMVSNFTISPKQGFAAVNIEPYDKVVRILEDEYIQGSRNVRSMPAMYYFIGSPEQIYKSFLEVRNREGYSVYKPKHEWFGVGWEAYGALAWNTTQETVTENINQYLELGYPLRWMVVGSGFWPSGGDEFDEHGEPFRRDHLGRKVEARSLQTTTSFGMWDHNKYPDPKGMIDNFHKLGLKFIIGLRIAFLPGGAFTDEGLSSGYFIKDEEGEARLISVGFPREPVYLLDTHNPDAADWYVELCQKWLDYGIDGFKEDLYGYPYWLPDDVINPVNSALMDQGVYIMGRSNYLGSPVDIHRYEDFNYNVGQDRGPINGLAFAYSGFPYVYPDIVGGSGLATRRFGGEEEKLRIYLMRYATYAALNPSMSFGYGPWNFDEEVVEVTRNAAHLHDRLHPYIYSYAIKAYRDGFPWTMTPLPLAYPDDPGVYDLANTTRRSYQWMIGESLLATPLYGDDYATATSRDVYLPKGTWMEYESGAIHQGPATLYDYALPVEKIPLFVGGKGVLIEQINGNLRARVYPVTDKAEMVFYDKDGNTQSNIIIDSPNWDALNVINLTSGEKVEVEWHRHAYEFSLKPGNDYKLK